MKGGFAYQGRVLARLGGGASVDVLQVGFGRWGVNHLRALQALGCTVWIAELDDARRSKAVDLGVPKERTIADYREVLDRVGAVDVVTSAESHLDVATVALKAGLHCFVEKPLALRAREGRYLARLATEVDRVLHVGHIYRFHPVTAAVHQALGRGRIGCIRFATASFSGFKRPRLDIGITHTDAIHFFDLGYFLLGRRATSVRGYQRDFLGRHMDDLSIIVVEFGDIPAVIEANYFVPGTVRYFTVVGELGVVVADFATGAATLHRGYHRRGANSWEAIGQGTEELGLSSEEPLLTELRLFLAACAGGEGGGVSAEEAVHSLEIVEAASRAAGLDRGVMVSCADGAAGDPRHRPSAVQLLDHVEGGDG